MTWREFKAWAEAHGIEDADVVRYIDWSTEPESVEIERVRDGVRTVCIC